MRLDNSGIQSDHGAVTRRVGCGFRSTNNLKSPLAKSENIRQMFSSNGRKTNGYFSKKVLVIFGLQYTRNGTAKKSIFVKFLHENDTEI